MNGNVEAQLVGAIWITIELSRFAAQKRLFTHVASHEKLFDPAGFVDAVSQIAGLDIPIGSQQAAVKAICTEPENYLTMIHLGHGPQTKRQKTTILNVATKKRSTDYYLTRRFLNIPNLK